MKLLLGTVRACPQCAALLRLGRRFRSDAGYGISGRRATTRDSGDSKRPGVRRDLDDASTATRFGRSDRESKKYALFGALVDSRLTQVLEKMGKWTPDHKEYRSFGLNSQAEVDREAKLYRKTVSQCFLLASRAGLVGRRDNPMFWNLRNAFVRGDSNGLGKELKYGFQSFVLRSRFSKAVTTLHQKIADLRYPYEWFPATRAMQRTVHLHVGPTNSGKTYRALKALEAASSGIYAGPLRLLAHEIYSRFVAKGKPCALVTGEEKRIPEGEDIYFQSCTVEMTPTNRMVDVAVIDEIQMMADDQRGWAWTQAFLGVQAREVHLCGEERAVDIVQSLCARIGDKCVVHRYKRLSSLMTMKESLGGNLENLRKGDCVVSFSRVSLYSIKAGIEKATGRRCAIVYGSLPPETRAQQAALFNDPDNDYDFLVASDAIGMGLNLEIKRVIFETVAKHDGATYRLLEVPEVKQIGGRAGRYRTASQAIRAASQDPDGAAPASAPAPADQKWGTPGFVTTLEDEDLKHVHEAFETEAAPIETAGVNPPTFAIENFARYFPQHTPFSFILLRFRELARLSERFHLCDIDTAIEIADIIQPFPLSIYDRCIFISCPVTLRDPGQREILAAFAQCVAEMKDGRLLDFKELNLEILDATRESYYLGAEAYLKELESLHKAITMYLWLSYRYQGVFQSQELAFHVKSLVEEKITEYLEHLSFVPEQRQRLVDTRRRLAGRAHEREELLRSESTAHLPSHEGPGQWEEEGHEEPLMEDDEEASLGDNEQQHQPDVVDGSREPPATRQEAPV